LAGNKNVKRTRSPTANERWDAIFNLMKYLINDKTVPQSKRSGPEPNNERLFAPFTTTLVEIRLDRDALPLDLSKMSKLVQ